jgi:hypothetical protein
MALLSKPGLIPVKIENQGDQITTQVNKINFTGSGVTASIGQFNDVTILINGGTILSASYALSASFASIASTASYFSGSITNAISASYVLPLTQSVSIKGLGTTSATTALRVENANASASLVVFDDRRSIFYNNVGITGSLTVLTNGNALTLRGLDNKTLTLRAEGSDAYIDATGQNYLILRGSNLGIKLQRLTGNDINVVLGSDPQSIQVTNGTMFLRTQNTPRLTILSGSGYIGIATTTPVYNLDVSGSGRFTDSLIVTGSLIAPTITGSLQGTSSWANNTISSSFALTASLAPLYVLNSRTSSFATTGSNTFKDNQIVTGSITSTSEITAAGNVTAQINLKSMYQSGDEGGEIFLNAPATNTTIPNGVTIDVYQNRLRIFEQGGAANGYYLEMPSGSAGVGTNLKPAGFTGTVTIFGNPPPNNLNFTDGILTSVT